MRRSKYMNWVLIILALLSLFGVWYSLKYSMGVSQPFEVIDPHHKKKILIATQQSEYKNKVTKAITDELAGKEIYVNVIDITNLNSKLHFDYDAYILIHTWEIWKVPEELRRFIDEMNSNGRMYSIGTSGGGDLVLEGVDGITSASILIDAEKDAAKALSWLGDQFAF